MRTLRLNLKSRWFDMIASGVKTEEYREIKPYWRKRLMNYTCQTFTKYDTVTFLKGYPKADDTDRSMTFECKQISIGKGKPEWGAPETDNVFIIKLGKRIS